MLKGFRLIIIRLFSNNDACVPDHRDKKATGPARPELFQEEQKMTKKHSIMLIFLVIPLVTLFVGLGAASQKTITWGSLSEPETLDPGQAWDNVSVFFTSNLFDTLVVLDPKTLEITPSLAVSWETKNNGIDWEFKLRKGVRFHDGSEFNADAVVFSFQRQMDKNFPYRYYDFPLFDEIFKNIVSVESVGTHTVVFHLNQPFHPFLSTLTASPAAIVSPTAVKKHKKAFARNPVGTGPFTFTLWEESKQIALEANHLYWKGKPRFDHFVYVVTDKHDKLHRLFREQKLDVIDSISISRATGLKNVRWATVRHIPVLSVTYIAINLKNRYLKNIDIRRALRSAWDPRILRYVFQGFVTPLDSIIPKGMPGHKTTSTRSRFNLTKARGWLEKAKVNEPIKLKFLLSGDSDLSRQLVSLYTKNLKRLGIELKTVYLPLEEYEKQIAKGDFDLTINGWTADFPDPCSIISPLFNAQLMEKGFPNLSQYQNASMKAQIDSLAKEMDRSKRTQKVSDIIHQIDALSLCIPIYQDTAIVIYNNKKIKSISVTPTDTILLNNIEKK